MRNCVQIDLIRPSPESTLRRPNGLENLGHSYATTSVSMPFGGYGGIGEPSAVSVRSMVTHLPAGSLTDGTTGSNIQKPKIKTATAIVVFFKGVSLLPNRLRRDGSHGAPG